MQTDTPLAADFERLRSAGSSLTLLRIGADVLQIVSGGDRGPTRFDLPLGELLLANGHFRHEPPSAAELENAIMVVEDTLAPVREHLAADSRLMSTDPGIRHIARAAGLAGSAGEFLTRDAIENAFGQLCRIALGAPRPTGFPDGNDFAARLLILREWTHHMDFDGITLAD
ncbi:hypothetical protein [Paludibacterium paludis]|uniref:Uncharacterized protein n=1 Tax=Paludibacterium paludis TaxID=1225769 RepID=A0A918P4S8_9NEIS|nr:hypothetical protein [Paludibacterium paludis]GGY22734.1 hypothetical protein GCM10011289_28290 [Paludibacterium paludis]